MGKDKTAAGPKALKAGQRGEYGKLEHDQAWADLGGRRVQVDAILKPLLELMNNRLGWRTLRSCAGGWKLHPRDRDTTWAYVSFARRADADGFFQAIGDHVAEVRWEGHRDRKSCQRLVPFELAEACVRFHPNDLATVVRRVRRAARKAEKDGRAGA